MFLVIQRVVEEALYEKGAFTAKHCLQIGFVPLHYDNSDLIMFQFRYNTLGSRLIGTIASSQVNYKYTDSKETKTLGRNIFY